MGTMNSRLVSVLFAASLLGAAMAPLALSEKRDATAAANFPGWPVRYENRPIAQLPMTSREEGFARDFPGRIGRFSDGEREIIMRWVSEPTRRLHPAADCFRGSGYAITPLPMQRNEAGALMGCFKSVRGGEALTVCESLHDEHGRSWSDASAWYWTATFDVSSGPWWSVVVAQKSHPALPADGL